MGRLAARERLGENALFLVDAVFRDDQLPQEVVHRLCAGVAEDRFGTPTPIQRAAVRCSRDDRVWRLFEQQPAEIRFHVRSHVRCHPSTPDQMSACLERPSPAE